MEICVPMSRANIRIRAKINSPVKDGIWIPAFAGMTNGGASRHPTVSTNPKFEVRNPKQARIIKI